MSLIKNHIPLFILLQNFSVQIDFFRQHEITVRIRTDHSQSLIKESGVEKPLGKKHRELHKEKGLVNLKVVNTALEKLIALSVPYISFIILSRFSKLIFQKYNNYSHLFLVVGLDSQYF